MAKVKSLESVNKIGESIWYDNLSKKVLDSGKLKELIDQGVSGLTSNPTIFKKAIADSSDYDADLIPLKGTDADEATEQLMIKDVARAADLLLPIYQASNGKDGHASIEVSPKLANDTEGTVEAAQRIWKTLGRENIMIKIPATKAGIPAIKKVLELGINVNVTLIFSVEVYNQVVESFISAVEARVAKGLDVSKLASVASFFVSRVDLACEKAIEKLGTDDAKGLIAKVGIDNSYLAYQSFLNLFNSERFKKLPNAQVQRPLWASTGTKNPAFDPLLYVKALCLPDTVNTLPPETLEHLLKADVISDVQSEVTKGGDYVKKAKQVGINLDQILIELEQQGVSSFVQSYEELVASVAAKI